MILDIKLPDYDAECLFETADTIREDGVSSCDVCDLNQYCNAATEAMCTQLLGYGKHWKELDCDEEALIRMERQLAHG